MTDDANTAASSESLDTAAKPKKIVREEIKDRHTSQLGHGYDEPRRARSADDTEAGRQAQVKARSVTTKPVVTRSVVPGQL